MDLSNKISFVMDQDLILITLKNAAKSLLYILRNFDVEDLEKIWCGRFKKLERVRQAAPTSNENAIIFAGILNLHCVAD